jgi:Domain of Unknown Function (DUF1259)
MDDAAFHGPHLVGRFYTNRAMLMGDTVLFEDEVNPAMSAALDAGLGVTALHNHFFFDEPKVYFMHISGMGDAKTLAAGVKAIYGKVDEVRAAQPQPQKMFGGTKIAATNSISPEPLEAILGTKGDQEEPRVLFLHYWEKGKASALAHYPVSESVKKG